MAAIHSSLPLIDNFEFEGCCDASNSDEPLFIVNVSEPEVIALLKVMIGDKLANSKPTLPVCST